MTVGTKHHEPPLRQGLRRDLVQRRDLVMTLVSRQLKVRYRRSVIGLLWTMLHPLLMMGVLYVVFSSVFRFEIANYAVYVLSGLLFWNFFSQSVVTTMGSLAANAALLQQLPARQIVFPLSTVLAGVVNLVLSSASLFLILLATRHPITPALLVLPFSVLVAAAFTLGIGLLLAPLAVFFKTDTTELVSVVLTLLYFSTPVFYPADIIPGGFAAFVRLNPVRVILELLRQPIYAGHLPPAGHTLAAVALATVSLLIGIVVFRRAAKRVPFYL